MLQARLGGDDVVFALQIVRQLGGNVRIIDLGVGQGFGQPLIQIRPCDLQLVPTSVIEQGERRAVFDGVLEVIGRQIATKNLLGDLVVREQRRTGKADEARIRQPLAHV